MDRQGTLRWEHNPIYCPTFSCSTLSAPGRWAFVRKHPIRCADKSPWIGQETPLDSSHIPPSSHEQHPSQPCPEGTFFHSPGFVRSTTLGYGPVTIISPEGAGLTGPGRGIAGGIRSGFSVSADRRRGRCPRSTRQPNPDRFQAALWMALTRGRRVRDNPGLRDVPPISGCWSACDAGRRRFV